MSRARRSEAIGIGLAAAVGLSISYLATASGELERLGIHGQLAKLGIATLVTVALILQRLAVRRRAIGALVRVSPKPLCTVKDAAFGLLPSTLARPRREDGSAPYVERDRDGGLAKLLGESSLVILVGGSGVGKTTTLLNVARGVLGGWRVLAPREPGPGNKDGVLTRLLELTMAYPWRLFSYVLWIDDLGRYLDEGGVDVAQFTRWLECNTKRKIVATLGSADQDRHEQAGGSTRRVLERLLAIADTHEIRVDWTKAEQRRARKAYTKLSADAYQRFAHYLAFTPLLKDRYRRSVEAYGPAAVLIRTIADCRRVGIAPVSRELALALIPLYLRSPLATPGELEPLLEQGIEQACAPLKGGLSLVLAVGDKPLYTVPDVVVELVQEEEPAFPDNFWATLLACCADGRERVRLAQSALIYARKDVADEAIAAVMRDEAVEANVRRAAHQLRMQIPSRATGEVGALLQRASGEAPQPQALTPELAGLLSGAWQTRHRLLAAIDRSPLAKTVARFTTLFAFDVTSLWGAFVAAYWMLDGAGLERARSAVDQRIAFVVLVGSLLFYTAGLYRARTRRANFARLLAAVTQVGCTFLILRLIAGPAIGSISLIVFTTAFAFLTLSLARTIHAAATRALYRMALGGHPRRAWIGTRDQVKRMLELESDSGSEHETVGWIITSGLPGKANGAHCLGTLDQLRQLIERHMLNELVLCDRSLDEAQTTRIADIAWRHVDLYSVSRRGFLVRASRYAPGEQLSLDELRVPALDANQRVIKRSFDIVLASGLLVGLTPLLMLLWLTVRLSSSGPGIQSVSREGVGTLPFEMLRFRTTYIPAVPGGETSVTPFGRVLRRFGIHNLPQLANVLRGDMSLVGPVPISEEQRRKLPEWQMRRLLVPPGMTGLWQVSGRRDHDFADMVDFDFRYVQQWSVFEDAEILLKSISTSIRGRYAKIASEPTVDADSADSLAPRN